MFCIFCPYIISTVYIVDVTGCATIMDVWGWQKIMVDLKTLTFDLDGDSFLDNDDCQS